jgi:hypothetical protein
MELHDSLQADSAEERQLPEPPRCGLSELAPPDVYDPVVEAYKKDVDRTLLIENLKLTPQERSQNFLRFMEMIYEVQRAGEVSRSSRNKE